MSQVSFCCSNSQGAVLDRRVVEIDNLVAAREYAVGLIRSFSAMTPLGNWRSYRLRAQDERGADIFVMPFWSTLSRPTLTSRLKARLPLGTWY